MAESEFRCNLGNLPESKAGSAGNGSSFFFRCGCDESGGLLGLRAEFNGKMGRMSRARWERNHRIVIDGIE
jgi:hypothetical protein